MDAEALVAWIATALVGLSLLGVWVGRGGLRLRGARRLTPKLLLTHIGPAVTGLVVWVAYLVSDEPALTWVAFALLLFVAVLGSTQFYIWQQRRTGILRATEHHWDLAPIAVTDESIPAEQHFPVGVVVAHGVLAILTLTFVLITAINESSRASGTAVLDPITGSPSSVTATTARLEGNLGDRRGRARFDWGESRRYGRSVPGRTTSRGEVTADLAGLLPASVYHYRLMVGDRRGGDRTLITAVPRRVRLRRVSIVPRRFGAAGRATARFTLNAPATVRVGVYRVAGARLRRVATVVYDGRAGRNSFPFAGRPDIRGLPPGTYKVVFVGAVAGGRPSAPRAVRVRMVA